MTPDAFYLTLAQRPELTPSKMFGWDGLKCGSSYVAFTNKGRVAIKLPPDVYAEAAALDGTRPFDPGENGRPMKGWLELPATLDQQVWSDFAESGIAFVGSQAPQKAASKKKAPKASGTKKPSSKRP